MSNNTIESQIAQRAQSWMKAPFDAETINEVKQLYENDAEELTDSFYKDLEFGTGGLRGIMGVGTNRMNKYTVGMATQGLSNYLLKMFPGKPVSVAIAYDSRNNSALFAKVAANVLSGNGIGVFLFDDIRPTPELSFAIRYFGCQSGIMITASHNPKAYNGYKAYWEDGAQLVSPHDKNVIAEAGKINSIEEVVWEGNEEIITVVGKEVDDAYYEEICALSLLDKEIYHTHGDLSIVYSPLHGTGIRAVPEAMKRFGIANLIIVEEQSIPDGNFPTVTSPNPEEAAAMDMSLKLAEKHHADLVMATDPDGDRVGIAVRNSKGELVLLNGNQTAALIIYYILTLKNESGELSGNDYIVKTIVTSYLLDEIATSFNIQCFNTLTGFKHIASVIREREDTMNFVAGGEESYGYLIGDFVRDKDAVSACCIIAELAIWAKSRDMGLWQILQEIHRKYGIYQERLVSVTRKGKKGAEEIEQMMENFRNNTPETINNVKVKQVKDYRSGITTDTVTGKESPMTFPPSNVIQYILENKTIITMRPSGTEPKIKFYISAVAGHNTEIGSYDQQIAALNQYIDKIISALGI
ncbi:MAG: phospho-sugar mutase [Bacteroidales bacterium]|nr:phospho-sugar mutase [Bacteroidales bacterium]